MVSLSCVLFILTRTLSGCGMAFGLPYHENSTDSSFSIAQAAGESAEKADGFASSLCVTDGAVAADGVTISENAAGVLFDVNNREVLYAQNVFTQLYPASLTKVMTALVALDNASPDTVLTASETVNQLEPGAQTAGIMPGDTMTLNQALHIMLINSANDAANLIAESVGGTTESFVQMINDEAAKLGATKTHFVNSNGLTDENHYTTPYDIYLIFNSAMQNELFREIINTATYSTVYHDRDGNDKTCDVTTTNQYLTGGVSAPQGITIVGGKTGTTNAAGHCLVLLVRNSAGNPYITIVMRETNQDALYTDMNSLLGLIPAG